MKNPLKVFSLQTTFFVSFMILSGVLIALLGVTGYYITNQEVVDKTISSRILLLDEINKQLDLQLQTIEYDSLVVASNPQVKQYLQQPEDSFERVGQYNMIIDMLSRHSYVKEAVHSVQLYVKNSLSSRYRGANGVFTYDFLQNSPYYERIQHADYVWLGTHSLEVGDYIGSPENVISFVRKVLSSSGEEVGILVFNIKLSYMYDLISGGKAEGGRYILDTNRRLIVESNRSNADPLAYEAIEQPLRNTLKQDDQATNHAIVSWEEKQLVIWNKQQRTQWISVDIIPWDYITEGSKRIQTIIMIAAVLCVIFAVAMAYVLSRQFVKPIRKLVKSMNSFKTGQLATQVENEYENEIGYLNQNFNEMTKNIKELIVQLNEQNKSKREAELQVLQEQMNPHFLYNTLDIMNWHAIDAGASDISRMLSLLGKMLRIGLSGGGTFIPLALEMEHLKCYVELQRIRYQQQIRFEIDMDERLLVYWLPKLTLQPLVENAIIHGFHSRRSGYIRISGHENKHTLCLCVEDNGHGMNTEELPSSREHHGLRNIKERFRLYFGPSGGLRVESAPDLGTKIMLSLPKLMQEPSEFKQLEEEKPND
ncbi:sensor histidine kinase [Paenibacillus chungangensis]|uniref:Sensor histidine kinase n=1 Tax=Paenibacillus chungangensis TaxID=696535 RepID=A0ABW3HWK4_9BACL